MVCRFDARGISTGSTGQKVAQDAQVAQATTLDVGALRIPEMTCVPLNLCGGGLALNYIRWPLAPAGIPHPCPVRLAMAPPCAPCPLSRHPSSLPCAPGYGALCPALR